MKSNVIELLKPKELPQGGYLAISQEVAALFIAHIELLVARGDDARFEEAHAKRDMLLANMTQGQRENVALVASAVGRLVA